MVKVINRSDRRGVYEASHAAEDTAVDYLARTEIDNHADTCCFGPNFAIISMTGVKCSVSTFSKEHEAMEDVEVASAYTAYDNPDDCRTYILEFNEGLWFGNRMDHSLINPNQVRMTGISLCDDPFDPNRALGIDIESHPLFIPFQLKGTTIFFETRRPKPEEYFSCPRITMTSPVPWDPVTVTLRSPSPEEEETMRYISAVKTNRMIYDSIGKAMMRDDVPEIGDSDRVLSSVSSVYSPEPFVQKVLQVGTERMIARMESKTRHSLVNPETLSRKWRIGFETAKKTLAATTQLAVRTASVPLYRRYRTDLMSLRYNRLADRFYTDTLFAKVKSLSGKTCMQVFCNADFVYTYAMTSKSEVAEALHNLVQDVGVPTDLVSDLASEQTGRNSDFVKEANRLRIRQRGTEPMSQWQNKAEKVIGELKKRWLRRKTERNIPGRLWDYGLQWESEIMSRTARGPLERTGIERISGYTPDISEWIDFEFYDLVWFWDTNKRLRDPSIEDGHRRLGRWIGIAHRVGSDLCYWVLPDTGIPMARTTVQHVTELELQTDEIKAKVTSFDVKLRERLKDKNHVIKDFEAGETDMFIEDEEEQDSEMVEQNAPNLDEELEDFTPESYDTLLNAELMLPHGDQMIRGRVAKRAKDDEGRPIGRRHDNPLLDTREYEVELPDGSTGQYTANVIAENIFSQVDEEGRQYVLLSEIVDHKKDATAITKDEGYTISHNGRRVPKITTRGWKIQVEWKDGSTDWVPMNELKASNPIELAEYAVANKIVEEPAFAWWVKDVLRRRNRIVAKVKSRYWKTTHKFGIEVPKDVERALKIDQETGTTFWREAIDKEMTKVMVAFEEWDGTIEEARSGKKLVGYTEIKCHMIFDVKMDGKFTRKARFVADGSRTEAPASMTYSSVVSRESVRIAFLIAALNDLEVCAADVGNAYLNAPSREKLWTAAGHEFGSNKGKVMLIVRALYGTKSAGASWRKMLAETMADLKYKPTRADPDVWIRPMVKPDGFEYYEMLLIFVDDLLGVSHAPKETMDALAKLYELKAGSVGEPTMYLGANIEKFQLPDGRIVWSQSGRDYVKNAVKIVKGMMEEDGYKLKGKADRPYPQNYRPECDVSDELDTKLTRRYMSLIGMLRWAVELGRIDILTETGNLSCHMALPRKGHLEAVYSIFAYLAKHENSRIVFDDRPIECREEDFKTVDWSSQYAEVPMEELPPNMPEPRGRSLRHTIFVDADHAGNVVTRRSQTGFVQFLNGAPIDWYSKRQNTVEGSTFGSEFNALRTATDRGIALRYKLRMFGIPVEGPIDVYCDNEGVVKNASIPESTLQKKHNSVCYHRVREAAAAGICRVAKEDGKTNIADLLTKTTQSTADKRRLCLALMW